MDFWLQVIFVTIIAYVVWFIIKWWTSYRELAKAASRITPVAAKHPIWGNLHLVNSLQKMIAVIRQVVTKTRTKLVVFWRMSSPIFITTHPDTAKILLKSLAPKPKQVGAAYHNILPWIGDGLLLSDGKKWERNRRLLTPAFHFDVLRPYMKIYNDVADVFLNKLWKCSSEGKESVEIYDPVGLAALDVMLRCALSYEGHVQEQGSTHPYVLAVKNLANLMNFRVMRPWLQFYWIFRLTSQGRQFHSLCKYVHEFDDSVIAKRKKALKDDPSLLQKRHLDFLDILVTAKDENEVGLSDKEIRDEVDTFLFEGHDTTASGIGWAMYCLAKYPQEQQKVYEEVSEILKDKSHIEWDDIPKLKKLSLFLKEVFRIYPPVPGIGRVLDKPMKVNGVTFPRGSNLSISIRNIHNHPDVWPDYETFRPERFLDDRDPYSFVPFSAGPRNCIGQNFALNEEKVIVARLLNRFKLTLDPDHKVEAVTMLVLRAKNGIKLRFQERGSNQITNLS